MSNEFSVGKIGMRDFGMCSSKESVVSKSETAQNYAERGRELREKMWEKGESNLNVSPQQLNRKQKRMKEHALRQRTYKVV